MGAGSRRIIPPEGPRGSLAALPGEYILPEWSQARVGRVAQMADAEEVLDRAQERVVVIGRRRPGARPDIGRQQHGSDPTAARTLEPRLVRASRQGLLVAACVIGVGRHAVRLIEGDDEEPVLTERR